MDSSQPLSPAETRTFIVERLGIDNPRDGIIGKFTFHNKIFVDPRTGDVVDISLHGFWLKTFDLHRLAQFPALQHFSLTDNFLKTIDLAPLTACPRLKTLGLGRNDFYGTLVDLTPLEGCPRLERLDLAGDMTLASMEYNLNSIRLAKIPALVDLDLSMNALEQIDLTPLSACSCLQTLSLRWNHLKALDLTPLDAGSSLQRLDLRFNHLTTLPHLPTLETLATLDLGLNQLVLLPDEFDRIPNLVSLDLSYTKLGELPPSIFGASSLRSLGLSQLPRAFLAQIAGLLPQFERLDLISQEWEGVPDHLQSCTALRELDLGYNHIRALPSWFPELTALEVLHLDHNPLTRDPKELLDLPRLREVSLPVALETDSIVEELRNTGVKVSFGRPMFF